MTIQDYFQNKIRLLGVPIIPENIDLFYKAVDILFLEVILMFLALPNVSEGDMSISYNREGLMMYYKAECRRLGVEDMLSKTNQPKVRDMSFLA